MKKDMNGNRVFDLKFYGEKILYDIEVPGLTKA